MKAIHLEAVYHMPWLEYRHALPDGRVCLRIRVGCGEWEKLTALYTEAYLDKPEMETVREAPMALAFRDGLHDVYEAIVAPLDPRLRYFFRLESERARFYLDQDGIYPENAMPRGGPALFPFAYAYAPQEQPAWARGCVGYQIFPDRFRRAGEPEDGIEPWTSRNYQNECRFGGNLAGIREAVPYLKELGVGLVYMTPIFLSDTSHRYNTFDYFTIDPLLGTREELKALTDELHAAGIRIVLDGVFNHCGLGFAPFQDAQAKGKESAFYDWFFFDERYEIGYQTFGYWRYMPKLNLQNPRARDYFLAVGRYWLESCGVDGWRLDVSPEVWPDFWRDYRRMVKSVNPEALLVAECWDDSREWLSVGDMFDSTMHYVLSRAMWAFFAEKEIPLSEFDARVNRALMLYPQRTQDVLWNFLSSHDTPRMISRGAGGERGLRMAAFFQMTHPGVPIVYYGDELGMQGGPDPDCRRPMEWEAVGKSRLQAYYRRLIALRSGSETLRRGVFRTHALLGDVYAYRRETERETLLCALNTGAGTRDVMLPLSGAFAEQKKLRDLLTERAFTVTSGCVRIRLRSGEGVVLGRMEA